jgi:hypothetical protein
MLGYHKIDSTPILLTLLAPPRLSINEGVL